MPRKKRTIVEETLPDEPTLEASTGEPLEFGSYKYKVFKLNGGEKSFCFQTEEPVDEVSLQAQYPNGGKFAVQIILNGSINDTEYYTIEPKPITASSNNSDDIRVRLLMDELNFTRQLVLNSLGNHAQTPITELIAAMQGLHALAPAKIDPTDLLIKGMELGAKSGGASSDWKSELIHTVKTALPDVMQTMQAMRANPPAQINEPITGEPRMLPAGMIVKQGINWIKNQIMAGLDPGLAVEWIMQNANDVTYQPFLSLAINGTIDNFIELDADIAKEPYKTWFESAISMLKEAYAATTQVSKDSADNGRGNGDGSNVTIDAKSSATKHNLTKVV